MISKLFVLVLFGYALAAPSKAECNANNCKLPNCRCPSTNIPLGLSPKNIPQLVLFTFDDAVSAINFDFYEQAFNNKKNPDGCPVAATFFTSHEYTDYEKVHQLHAKGHEIALHSISHKALTTYWKDISVEDLLLEFGGEIDLISYFADIPKNDIKGMRLPFLQMSGDNSFMAMQKLGLKYDSSWPSIHNKNPILWPYTLDHKSSQDCPIGPCPTSKFPGIWVSPMIDWEDDNGIKCSMVDSCVNIPINSTEGLFKFMKRNFERHYNGNRAPFGFYIHAAWFLTNPLHFEAYLKFVEYVNNLSDVYIVSTQRALDWIQNPSTITDIKHSWPSCQKTKTPTCRANSCKLRKDDQERYMTACSECPKEYPWLGNPLGVSDE